MRAEFYRGEKAETVVGTARWAGDRVEVESDDADARAAIARIFRLTPVVVDDRSLLSLGASGEAALQPGSLEWFQAAAVRRGADEGLSARLVPEATGRGGWDPASAYRTFRQSVRRILDDPSAEEASPAEGAS